MAKLTDTDVLALVEGEFNTAMGAPSGEISTERARAWKYYQSKPFGDEVPGFSSVVTSDVSDVVDGIMPSLLRLFTTEENLASFDASGPEDEDQAEQESDFVNYTFFKKNKGAFITLHTWFFDALTQKNGIVKAWWDDSEVVTEESYESLTMEEVAELFEDKELEPVDRSERTDTTVIDGQVVEGIVHDIKFKRVAKGGRVAVKNVAPENYRISSDADSVDPSDARMVGEEFEITRSDLIAMGFDEKIVNDLPTSNRRNSSPEEIARKDKTDDTRDGMPDKSQEKVLYREAYIKLDMEGDGKSELRQITTAGNKVLQNEPSDRPIFHVICPKPLPHKHFGTCPAEDVMDIQLVTSTLLRQTLDNLYRTNQPEHGVYEAAIGENTIDDLLTTRVGSINRFERPMNEAYAAMTVPFTAAASFPMLEYFDKEKRDRTGVNSDGDGLNPEQLKNIQTSVLTQANDISRMKIEAIARIFAETGIKSLFLHIHELLQKHQKKEQVVKLRNEWIPINPSAWQTRYDMTVQIGLGVGSRETNILHLGQIKEMQAAMVGAGGLGLTVSPKNIYNTAAQYVKNANFKDAEEFFTDPGDEPAPPPPPDPQQQAIIELQQNQQKLDAADLQQKQVKEENRHNEAMAGLALDKEANDDKTAVALENIMTAITKLELEYQTDIPDKGLTFNPADGSIA